MSVVFEAGYCGGRDPDRHHPVFATIYDRGACEPSVAVPDSWERVILAITGPDAAASGTLAAGEFAARVDGTFNHLGAGGGLTQQVRRSLDDLRSLALFARDHGHPVTWDRW